MITFTRNPVVPPEPFVRAAEPSEPAADTPELPFQIVVSPSQGRFLPAVTGGPVHAGQVLGHVAGDHGRRDAVVAPSGGHLRGVLRLARQPVRCGTGLYWIGDDPL
jgi:hypothetical protein